MSKLNWVTPIGTVANVLVGVPINIEIQTIDLDHLGLPVTYSVISGALPPGLSLSNTGVITGTPIYSDATGNYFSSLDFSFTVRARTTDDSVLDGTFKIIITNTVNGDFSWVTPAGNLGTVPDSQYYSLPLLAEDVANSQITYKLISGELPPGMQITTTGNLVGVPTILNPIAVDQAQTYRFSVRATNSLGHINDRSFSLTITNVFGPVIEPNAPLEEEYNSQTGQDQLASYPPGVVLLGSFFDGSLYNQQLTVPELNPNAQIQWSVASGSLPTGVTLSSAGVLNGYIQPLQLVGQYGPAGFDGDVTTQGVITQEQQYDSAPFDFNQLNLSLSYTFTIQAFDGANYALQNYVIEVVSRGSFTADSTNNINDTYLTVDALSEYPPVLLNTATVLPTARENSYYAFKFDGYDFQGDNITYSVSNTLGTFDSYILNADQGFDYAPFDSFDANTASTTNLPGLILDAQTGWLYGKLFPQTDALNNYSFGVQVSKVRNGITFSSTPIYFTLPVLGDVNNTINWVSPSNLGSIDNGRVSELTLVASSTEGKDLVYTLVDQANTPCRLPQGLTLLPSGDISGRVTFEAFTIDDYTTTFDGGTMTSDRTYNFFVKVSTVDGTASSVQEFTLTLNVIDIEPYNDLYLQALPAFDQRQIYNSVINNTEIFNPNLIYRSSDPWYGIQSNMEMLFLSGLSPDDLDAYQQAMVNNHYDKTYTFGDIKTAVVLNDLYKVKYEVVYIEVIDPSETSTGAGPGLEIDLTNIIANPYIDNTGGQYKIIYPDTSADMVERLVEGVGYQDQSSLPPWMTSNQPGNTSTTFNPPLGYTKAVVMAYTVPGASKLIAYRLKNSGINFNNIQFTADRYIVDNFYSTNFNSTSNLYNSGFETTFDTLPKQVGIIAATVNYGSNVPFDQINGRPLSYIISKGGIDGKIDFAQGETLIFVQQENYYNPGPYDGWVDYTNAYIGDNILTNTLEGYDVGSYDTYTVIPGFLEKAQGTSTQNQRGGVWKINIVNDIVNLEFVQEIEVNQRVQILRGATYSSAIVYYNPILEPGQSVPYYVVYKLIPTSLSKRTTFNANTTRFFSKRDQYYEPGTQDKYLKFPQIGVFI